MASARDMFRQMMNERRAFSAGSPEWAWRTNAARAYARICRGVPVSEWSQ